MILLSISFIQPPKNSFHHIPRGPQPTPWWNRFCEAAQKRKILCWQSNDITGFTHASLVTHSTYRQSAIQDYRDKIQKELQQYSTSRQWWSLTKSLMGFTSSSRPATPSAYQLAEFFSSKLFQPADSPPIPTLTDCHISLFSQFRIKVSHVRSILLPLDISKSIGDDNVSPCVLKSYAFALLWTPNCSISESMLYHNISQFMENQQNYSSLQEGCTL